MAFPKFSSKKFIQEYSKQSENHKRYPAAWMLRAQKYFSLTFSKQADDGQLY
jgi:hypothetical protein